MCLSNVFVYVVIIISPNSSASSTYQVYIFHDRHSRVLNFVTAAGFFHSRNNRTIYNCNWLFACCSALALAQIDSLILGVAGPCNEHTHRQQQHRRCAALRVLTPRSNNIFKRFLFPIRLSCLSTLGSTIEKWRYAVER